MSKIDTSREAVERLARHLECHGHVGPDDALQLRALLDERDQLQKLCGELASLNGVLQELGK